MFTMLLFLIAQTSDPASSGDVDQLVQPAQMLETPVVTSQDAQDQTVLVDKVTPVDPQSWANTTMDDSLVEIPDYNITELSPEMKAWVDTHVDGDSASSKKMKSLIQAVFSPDALNLIYDNSRTKTAKETFETRNGNCLSFTAMFIGFARYLGLNAYFQEVTNYPTWDRHGNVVVLNRHMNAMVRIDNVPYTLDFNPDADRQGQFTRLVSDERATSQFYNNIGAEFFQQGQIGLAIAHMKRAIEIDPNVSFNWSNLGVAYVARNQMDLAEEAYLKALDLNSKEYTAISNLERLYMRVGSEEKAAVYREQARRFRNKNPYYHLALGDTALEMEDFPTAIEHYKDAIRRKDRSHEFHFALARAYYLSGAQEKAQMELRSALIYSSYVYDKDRYSQKLNHLASEIKQTKR